MFRDGAAILGKLVQSGNGTPKDFPEPELVEEMRSSCGSRASKLLQTLKQDEFSKELLESTQADVAVGRMTEPIEQGRAQLTGVNVMPRFGVEQTSPRFIS